MYSVLYSCVSVAIPGIIKFAYRENIVTKVCDASSPVLKSRRCCSAGGGGGRGCRWSLQTLHLHSFTHEEKNNTTKKRQQERSAQNMEIWQKEKNQNEGSKKQIETKQRACKKVKKKKKKRSKANITLESIMNTNTPRIFGKIRNRFWACPLGPGEVVWWKKPEMKNLVTLSL